jgi:hypothetical protein
MDDMWRRTQTFSFFYFFTLSSFPIVLAVRPRMGGEATRQTAELVGCVWGGGGWGGGLRGRGGLNPAAFNTRSSSRSLAEAVDRWKATEAITARGD